MKNIIFVLMLSLTTAFACTKTYKSLELSGMEFRALKGAKNGSAYLTITQTGEIADKLIGSNCVFADHVEIHDHIVDPMTKAKKMIEIGALVIPGTHDDCSFITCWFEAKPHPVTLKKGGKHLMLMGIKPGATDLDTMEIELVFEKAGKIIVTFKAEDKTQNGGCCHDHGSKGHDKNDKTKH